jgi:simple sugar transport system ATP-binding protein
MTTVGAEFARPQPIAGIGSDVPLVAFEGVTKRFGALTVNADVSFELPRGKITALLGENGAGKTTAMNMLCGLYLPDAGRILVDGRPLPPGSPRAALAAGIGMVHQQFKLVESLTGFENISLALHRGAWRQPRRADAALQTVMAELGFELDLARSVWQMPLAVRQQLEILRVLAVGVRILVLDEPTSVLSPLESGRLFALLRRIAASGRAVVLISHKLAEVMAVADALVVMRAGQVVHCGPRAALSESALARLIVGDRAIPEGGRPQHAPGAPVLTVADLTVLDDLGQPAAEAVSLQLRAGELVALVGVAGNGQAELLDAIGGLRPVAAGRIEAPRQDGRRAFAFIPAQHLGTGLAPSLSVADNALLGHQRRPPFRRWISRAAMAAQARAVVARFGVATALDAPVRRLSGGNLQRVVLGRELLSAPALIVASFPTRGLDVGSAAAIRRALVEQAEQGAAVLLASEELDESLAIASRLLVMHRGRIVAERDPRAVDLAELGRLLTGGTA